MTDQTTQQLLNEIPATGKTLLIADENLPTANFSALASRDLKLLTNRFDVWKKASSVGIDSTYNDFDFSTLGNEPFQNICYRVSKEKPVVHHIINQAFSRLTDDGQLILAGEKNDGLKTYAKKAADFFNSNSPIKKVGNSYLAFIKKMSTVSAEPLDDKSYPKLRATIIANDRQLFSKPGVFGWDKIDRGSEFLVSQLPNFLKHLPDNATLLDLGCGYGYLSAAAQAYGFERIVATDNNAAAIAACQKNFDLLNIDGEVIADDAGSHIRERFNIVLCNPPFHQGFSVDGSLTDKFLATTKKVLRRSGKALFVVNAFVPLPQKAKAYFDKVDIVAENSSFKLVSVR